MEWETFALVFALFVVSVFGIAFISIGMECYNKHPDFKEEKKTNYNFMWPLLVVNVITLCLLLVGSGLHAAGYA